MYQADVLVVFGNLLSYHGFQLSIACGKNFI